jgi:hypothetical protein
VRIANVCRIDVQVHGDVAASLLDANGDGADLNVEVYLRHPDGHWAAVGSGNGTSMGIAGWSATRTAGDRLTLSRADDDLA